MPSKRNGRPSGKRRKMQDENTSNMSLQSATSPDTSARERVATPTARAPTKDDTSTEMQLQLCVLEGELFDLKFVVENHQTQIQKLVEANSQLKSELGDERQKSALLASKLNDQEQYSRRNNVRVFGVKDTNPKENAEQSEQKVLSLFNSILERPLQPGDIEIAHRTGRFTDKADRSIIVKCISRKAKIALIRNRKKLKGKKQSIAEDLTTQNVRLLQKAKELTCVVQTWSTEGRLFAKSATDKVKVIDSNTLLNEQLFATPQPRQIQPDRQTDKQSKQHSKQPTESRQIENARVATQSTPPSVSGSDATSSAQPPAHSSKAKKSVTVDPTHTSRVSENEDSDIAFVLAEMAIPPKAASTPGQENND